MDSLTRLLSVSAPHRVAGRISASYNQFLTFSADLPTRFDFFSLVGGSCMTTLCGDRSHGCVPIADHFGGADMGAFVCEGKLCIDAGENNVHS